MSELTQRRDILVYDAFVTESLIELRLA